MSNPKPVREANTSQFQQPATIFKQQASSHKQQPAHHFLWQDKHRAQRDRIASAQPAAHEKVMRSQEANNNTTRSQNEHTPKRQTVPCTIWLQPIEKENLQRIADSEKIRVCEVLPDLWFQVACWVSTQFVGDRAR